MVAKKVKVADYVNKELAELKEALQTTYNEIAELQKTKATNAMSKFNDRRILKKNIATLNQIICSNTRVATRKAFAGKKVKPNDIKKKVSHRMRVNLNSSEKSKQSVRRLRKFAKVQRPLRFSVIVNKPMTAM
ncbi:MAG: 60S ribosomal protein L35, L29 [Marteilia pararefringens]